MKNRMIKMLDIKCPIYNKIMDDPEFMDNPVCIRCGIMHSIEPAKNGLFFFEDERSSGRFQYYTSDEIKRVAKMRAFK